jgi:aminopeptidase-like protein
MKEIVSQLFPLHRTLVSDGTDLALELIGSNMPSDANYEVETYPPKKQVWTWRVPERYVVHEAYLEIEGGERVVDFKDNPLHLVSYSLPVDKILTWQELEPHLYYSTRRPRAIPWEFKFYERDWGFCLSKEQFDRLPRDKRYHAVIRSEFLTDPDSGLRIGVATVHPEGRATPEVGEILVCTHICHPWQANDDISGVSVAIELAHRLLEHPLPPGSMGVRFLFCPEQIGSICYLSNHEELIPKFKGGIFIEMAGNENSILLQRSRQDNHLIDRVARYVLKRRKVKYREGAYLSETRNDERVMNGPGVDIPTISLQRWPYDEYHTSDDNPNIIKENMLEEMADVVEEITRIYASNYIPRRTFRGPVFLSGYGLWIDWRTNRELNRNLEKIMLRLEGEHSVFDIAQELNMEYWAVREYLEKFRKNGLIQPLPLPR